MEAYFHSRGDGVRAAIVRTLSDVAARPSDCLVCVHVMIFSFTDRAIADTLVSAARLRPSAAFRILADWSQRGHAPSAIQHLIDSAPPNVEIRFTRDQPYLWDPRLERLRWSYHLSLGFLHHKCLIVLVDGRPSSLVCGSSNWTKHARESYENTLALSAGSRLEEDIIARFELEFEAMWNSGCESFSLAEAETHYAMLREQLRAEPVRPPQAARGLVKGTGKSLTAMSGEPISLASTVPECAASHEPSVAVAFSARPDGPNQRFGYAAENGERAFVLGGLSGVPRKRPYSMTSLSLSLIAHAAPTESILMAMYGLSQRVAEYGALIEAARRGVGLRLILDETVGEGIASRLKGIARHENLPIHVRTARRTMHQKYAVHPEQNAVITGTANMSTDASRRHVEHRMMIRNHPEITRAFIEDFESMWSESAD